MIKSRFLKNNLIVMASAVLGGILGYFFHFIVSRQISVAQYGELQSLLSVTLIFGVFNSALGYFAIRHTAVFASHEDWVANLDFTAYLQGKVFKFGMVVLVVLIVASPLLAMVLHFSSYIGFVVISLATFLSSMTVVYSEILRGWKKFFLLAMIGIATALAKLISGAILAVLSRKTAWVSFSFLITAVVSWYLSKSWSKEKIADRKVRNIQTDWPASNASRSDAGWKNKYFFETNIRKVAVNIFAFSLALILVSNLDVLLVKYFTSAETAGYYGAFGLLGKIVLWFNLSVVSIMLPDACADGHTGKRPDKKYLLTAYVLMALIALGLIGAYYFMPNFIINLFFGKKYLLDTQILWLFALMSYFLSILTFEANLSFAKHDFRVVYLLAMTVFLMVFSLAKYHGNLLEIVLALAGSFLIGYLLVFILNLSHEKRRICPIQ